MIELIPAIDLIDGRCVRLTRGDYDRKTVYDQSPVDVARHLEEIGFRRLHVVDLDGAKSHHVVNDAVLRDITASTRLKVDFGGGIKSRDDLRRVFEAGAALATIGSVAVTQPELLEEWMEEYGAERFVLGADVREGKISINGWKEDSATDLFQFLDTYYNRGVRNVLCTEISRDGTLEGPAVALYKSIMERFPLLHLIASGGVSADEDILELDHAGIPAVVFGKAMYEGRLNLERLCHLQNASSPA